MNNKQLLGKRIKELRKRKGMKHEQLAESVGLEPTLISNIENGYNYPSIQNLEKITKILNIKLKDVFTFEQYNDNSNLINAITDLLEKNPDKVKDFYKIAVALVE